MCEYSKRDVKRILKKNGWVLHHCKGSHEIYKNNRNQHLSVVPSRCNRLIMERLIKEFNMIV